MQKILLKKNDKQSAIIFKSENGYKNIFIMAVILKLNVAKISNAG